MEIGKGNREKIGKRMKERERYTRERNTNKRET